MAMLISVRQGWRALAALAVAAVMVLAGTPAAQARAITLSDPRGDAAGGHLDIVSVRVGNGTDHLVAHVHFARLTTGRLVLVADEGHDQAGFLVASTYVVGQGVVRNLVYAGGDRVKCPGLRTRWVSRSASVDISVPAGCLEHGEYGSLRFGFFTEARNGGDGDFAPGLAGDGDQRYTAPVARG